VLAEGRDRETAGGMQDLRTKKEIGGYQSNEEGPQIKSPRKKMKEEKNFVREVHPKSKTRSSKKKEEKCIPNPTEGKRQKPFKRPRVLKKKTS